MKKGIVEVRRLQSSLSETEKAYAVNTYCIYEYVIDGLPICAYACTSYETLISNDGGETFHSLLGTTREDNLSYFTSYGVTFEDIKDKVLGSDGAVKWIIELAVQGA